MEYVERIPGHSVRAVVSRTAAEQFEVFGYTYDSNTYFWLRLVCGWTDRRLFKKAFVCGEVLCLHGELTITCFGAEHKKDLMELGKSWEDQFPNVPIKFVYAPKTCKPKRLYHAVKYNQPSAERKDLAESEQKRFPLVMAALVSVAVILGAIQWVFAAINLLAMLR